LIPPNHSLADIVLTGMGIAGSQADFSILATDVIKQQVAVGGSVCRTCAEGDATKVVETLIGRDDIGTGVSLYLLIPDMDA